MLRQFTNISSWRKHDITIESHEVYTLNFRDTLPNIFVVNNPNLATLKISASSIPRNDSYEFKIEYNTTETVGRPIGTNNLYILNDSSVKIKITVFSIEKEFDPAILKNMNVSLDGYTIESSSEISGVKAGVEIPVRNNNTDANIVNMSTVLNGFDSVVYPAILEKLQALIDKKVVMDGSNMTLNGVQTDLSTVHSNLSTLITKLGGLDKLVKPADISDLISNTSLIKLYMTDIETTINKLNKYYTPENKGVYLNGAESFEHSATINERIHFGWLFNDGEDFNITVNGITVFTVLAGEQLSDFEIELDTNEVIRFSGENINCRIKYWTY